MLVDLELTAGIRLQANGGQVQAVGVAGATVTPEQGVGAQVLAGFQVQDDAAFGGFHALVLLPVAHHHATLAQVVVEGDRDFVVEEGQQIVEAVDQFNLDAQAAENRGVLTADHAGSVDQDLARGVLQVEDGIAVVDPRVGEVHIRGVVGPGAGGDHDIPGGQAFHALFLVENRQGVRVDKTGLPAVEVDAIAQVEAAAHVDLLLDHPSGHRQRHRVGDLPAVADFPEQLAGVEAHQLLDRMAQGFRGDGAAVGTAAADHAVTLDHRRPQVVLGGVECGTFPGRATADNQNIVIVGIHAPPLGDTVRRRARPR